MAVDVSLKSLEEVIWVFGMTSAPIPSGSIQDAGAAQDHDCEGRNRKRKEVIYHVLPD